tara:strand:- start:129 stop:569 length:441 start_codon:yes stop_codon:yes gene_type:complete
LGQHSQSGLTFREILVLLLVISAVVAALYPVVHARLDDYRLATAQSQLAELAEALERYKLDNHFYPTTEQGLAALVIMPTTDPVPRNWNSRGYLSGSVVPNDPWGSPYVYSSREEGRYYELKSLGGDGEPGGDDMASDIPGPVGEN